ncbi:hypothetical protein [Erwinia amylovora]
MKRHVVVKISFSLVALLGTLFCISSSAAMLSDNVAVSYTHLDVYKRQELKSLFGITPREFKKIEGFLDEEAVSYTHLDVYKRQELKSLFGITPREFKTIEGFLDEEARSGKNEFQPGGSAWYAFLYQQFSGNAQR